MRSAVLPSLLRCRLRHLPWLCLSAVVSVGTPALAQRSAGEKAAAEALFDEGLELLRAEKLQEACNRFEKSQNIDPAVGTLLYLAECYERTGRTASAWATFREAASSASASGQAERARVGAERAQKLEPRLSRWVVDVGSNAELSGLRVERDGEPIAAALFGEPLPIDPGEHTVSVSAPGYKAWSATLSVPAEKSEQKLQVPALEPEPSAPVAAPPAQPVEPAPVRDVTRPEARSRDYTWSWVTGGIGLVGIGAGVVFGLHAADLDAEAKDGCDGTRCFDPDGAKANKDARSSALIANIGYGVGVAGLGTALILALLEGGQDETADSTPRGEVATHGEWRLRPEVSLETTTLELTGQF
jgi:serine/threonine-protein kinase